MKSATKVADAFWGDGDVAAGDDAAYHPMAVSQRSGGDWIRPGESKGKPRAEVVSWPR